MNDDADEDDVAKDDKEDDKVKETLICIWQEIKEKEIKNSNNKRHKSREKPGIWRTNYSPSDS